MIKILKSNINKCYQNIIELLAPTSDRVMLVHSEFVILLSLFWPSCVLYVQFLLSVFLCLGFLQEKKTNILFGKYLEWVRPKLTLNALMEKGILTCGESKYT